MTESGATIATGSTEPTRPTAENAARRRPAGTVTGLLRAMGAFWTHDFYEQFSYPLTTVNRVISLGALIFLLYFGAQLVDEALWSEATGAGFFLFALVGVVATRLLGVTLGSFRSRIQRYQVTGLLEASLMTRTPLWATLLVMPTYDLTLSLAGGAVLLSAGLWLAGVSVTATGILVAGAYLVAGLVAFTAVGMISAAVTLVVKAGDPIARLTTLASLLLSGAYVPREVLPAPLAAAGEWLPMGPMVDGIRMGLFGATPAQETLPAHWRLFVLAAVLAPCALFASAYAIRRVLRDGTLTHY